MARLRWSSYTNLMSGESTRYHTKYFKLGRSLTTLLHTNNQTFIFPHSRRKKPRITFFWSSIISKRQKYFFQAEFCQNLFLPPCFLICTMNFHKKMRLSLRLPF